MLEGRLGMNTIERPEGFKEKRAEMTVQRVNPISDLQNMSIAEPTPVAAGKFVGAIASTPSAAAPPAPAAPDAPSEPSVKSSEDSPPEEL